jgi:hypothetical protein
MTSTPTLDPGARLAELIEVLGETATELADLSAGGTWGQVPTSGAADLVTAVLAHRDLLDAVATDGVRAVHAAGVLPDGHVSTKRWLEVGTQVSGASAAALIARGLALETDYAATRIAWLAGELTSDAVRELTTGISRALTRVPAGDRDRVRGEAETILLPLARTATIAQLRRGIDRLKLFVDPDGAARAVMDAHDDQYLRLTPVGDGVDLKGYLTAETAAALLTCLDQVVDGWYRTGSLGPEDQPTGDDRTDTLRRKHRRDHLNALALADLARRCLDSGSLGTKHAQRPHVTLTVHLDDLVHGIGGTLRLPGIGETLLPPASVARILCDADLTPVITRTTHAAGGEAADISGPGCGCDHDAISADTTRSHPVCRHQLADAIAERGREVLHVGRAHRTAPPRLRRALEVRDQHCAAPGCRIDASRCEAHHVHEWERGGSTDLDNMVLLCTRHHHAVHEGRMSIRRRPEHPPGHPDHWQLAPPPRPGEHQP